MKRFVLLILVLFFSITAFAQAQVYGTDASSQYSKYYAYNHNVSFEQGKFSFFLMSETANGKPGRVGVSYTNGKSAYADSRIVYPSEVVHDGKKYIVVALIQGEGFRFCEEKPKEIILPSKLEILCHGSLCFAQISTIKLPSTLKVIEGGVFYGTNLTEIQFPAGLEYLNAHFSNRSIAKITLPAKTKLVNLPFHPGDRITEINVDPANPYYTTHEGVLYTKDMKNLIYYPSIEKWEYTIPEGVEAIGPCAFQLKGIVNITFPKSLVRLGSECFGGTKLSNVTFSQPNNVKKVGNDVFRDTPFGNELLKDDIVIFNDDVLLKYKSDKNKITIPSHVKYIAGGVFYCRYKLKSVIFPPNLKFIGDWAFQDCHEMTVYNLPPTLEEIDDKAFSYNWKLTSINLPNSVTRMGNDIFEGTDHLAVCNIPTGLKEMGEGCFKGVKFTSAEIPEGIKVLPYGVFDFCVNLATVKLPMSLEEIGAYCFSYTKIQSVYLSKNLRKIGNYAFKNCKSLKSITVDAADVPDMGEDVFWEVSNSVRVTVPASSKAKYKQHPQWKSFVGIRD